jgi:hypothetical protein
MTKEQKIILRTVEEKDLDRLPEFLSEGFPNDPPELWKARFDMWWKANPFMDSSIPPGWILEKDRSRIFGFIGNIPVKYQINGKIGNAVASSSWYVRPEVQGIWSIKLFYAFLKQANVDMFLNTTPVENVEKIIEKLGFSPLKLPFNQTEYWYLIDYDKIFNLFTNRFLKSRKILYPFIKITSFKLKVFSQIKRRYKNNLGDKSATSNYECSLCTHCDDSFTELWEKNRKENATTLYRDARTLNWLYFADAVKEKRFVIKCTQKPDDRVVGYMVFDRDYHHDVEVKILKLKDAYIPRINEQIISSFIAFSLNLAKELNASALRLWAADQTMEKILKKKMKTKRKLIIPYYYKLDKILDLEIKQNKNHEFIPSTIDPNRGNL